MNNTQHDHPFADARELTKQDWSAAKQDLGEYVPQKRFECQDCDYIGDKEALQNHVLNSKMKHRMKPQQQEMTLLILPTKQVRELELLKKTNWQYVESITDIKTEMDISESLQQIKEFYG